MTYGERYNSPVSLSFQIVESECAEISFDDCLQMANKAVNDSVRPGGLVHTVLGFVSYLRVGFAHEAPILPMNFVRLPFARTKML